MSHPNRNWHRRWSVDFETQTASHEDGWVFEFSKVADGVFDGRLIAQPEKLTLNKSKAHPELPKKQAKHGNAPEETDNNESYK